MAEKQLDFHHFKAFTDGSYKRGIKRCGFGIVITDANKNILCGIYGYTDSKKKLEMWNVGGEIEAAEMLIEYVLDQGWPAITIYHDYEGIAKWPKGEWKCNKPATQDYAHQMQMLMSRIQVRFRHVRGHTGVVCNEYADQLAKAGLYCDKKINVVDMKDVEKLGIDRIINYQTLWSVDHKEEGHFYGT